MQIAIHPYLQTIMHLLINGHDSMCMLIDSNTYVIHISGCSSQKKIMMH